MTHRNCHPMWIQRFALFLCLISAKLVFEALNVPNLEKKYGKFIFTLPQYECVFGFFFFFFFWGGGGYTAISLSVCLSVYKMLVSVKALAVVYSHI